MTPTPRVGWATHCAYCERSGPHAGTEHLARELAYAEGWVRGHLRGYASESTIGHPLTMQLDLCPECAELVTRHKMGMSC